MIIISAGLLGVAQEPVAGAASCEDIGEMRDNNTVIRLLIDTVPGVWANNWSVYTARMNFMV